MKVGVVGNGRHGGNASLGGIWKVTLRVRSVNTFPYEGKGDHVVVDEVRDSKTRPISATAPQLRRCIVLPFEGKGDHVVVVEVN